MAECDMRGCNGMARPSVCEGHAKQVRETVQALPVYYVRLHGRLQPGGAGLGEHVTGTRSPQAAMSMAVFSAMEDMVAITHKWARLAREHRDVGPLKSVRRPGVALTLAVESLRRHDETLLQLTIASEYVAEMKSLRQRAEVLLKQDKLIHRLTAPCPACEMRLLMREDGSQWVRCASCGATWDEHEYTRLVRVLAYQLTTLEHRA